MLSFKPSFSCSSFPGCTPPLKFPASFNMAFLLELSFQIWVTASSLLSDGVLLFCVGLLNCPLMFYTRLIPNNPPLNAPLIVIIWTCQLFPARILIWWTFSSFCFSPLVTVLLWAFWYKSSCGHMGKFLQGTHPGEQSCGLQDKIFPALLDHVTLPSRILAPTYIPTSRVWEFPVTLPCLFLVQEIFIAVLLHSLVSCGE